jgi:hypothetical protein
MAGLYDRDHVPVKLSTFALKYKQTPRSLLGLLGACGGLGQVVPQDSDNLLLILGAHPQEGTGGDGSRAGPHVDGLLEIGFAALGKAAAAIAAHLKVQGAATAFVLNVAAKLMDAA